VTDHQTSDSRPETAPTDGDAESTTPAPSPDSAVTTPVTRPPATGSTRTPVRRRHRVQLGAAAAVLLLVGGLGGWATAAVTSDDGHDHGARFGEEHGRVFGPGGPGGFGPGVPGWPVGPGDHRGPDRPR
jgi:hypothetical protein